MTALLRARMRRDRVQVPLWIAGTALLAAAGYAGVVQSYGTVTERQEILAAVMANPVILMFRGLPSGTSEGAFLAFEVLPGLAMLAALMSSFLAVRHTRGDEEAGRAELVSATPAGRTLPAVATLVHGLVANVALTALTALALIATGLDVPGSLFTGAASGATGVAFLGLGLIAAQLMRTSRGANALTVWALVTLFLVRGIGNAAGTPSDDLTRIDSSWIAWLSPFGWAEQTRPYDADDVWPVALGVAVGLALAVAAIALQSVRDLGAALVPARRGRARARATLSSPQALVWRLGSGALVGWVLGGALTGILATTLSAVAVRIAGENPAVSEVLERIARAGSLDEAVITVFFTMLGILAACAAVQTLAHARQEEAHGTAEPVLATPVGRVRWLAGYLSVATGAVVVVVGAAVVAGCLALTAAGGESDLYRVVVITGLGQVVAASVFVVVTALVFVLLPRATIGVAWALVVVGAMLGLFGPLFGLPEWAGELSPFAGAPTVSGGDVDLRGLWWLLGAVAVGGAAALALMRRRELAPGG
ncbi:ABC transporter permease [Microbacterium sp.]|uniref:ABC transporter permease n=1 Tax=Microbacterium sp. TaxID=51671 RepID=UPI0039E6C465